MKKTKKEATRPRPHAVRLARPLLQRNAAAFSRAH